MDVDATSGAGYSGRGHEILQACLDRPAAARAEQDVHAVQRLLLAETDNGCHRGDRQWGARSTRC